MCVCMYVVGILRSKVRSIRLSMYGIDTN
jgi:hypothetical protein